MSSPSGRTKRKKIYADLLQLDDHLLKDIGLRRVKVRYEFPTPFWHRD